MSNSSRINNNNDEYKCKSHRDQIELNSFKIHVRSTPMRDTIYKELYTISTKRSIGFLTKALDHSNQMTGSQLDFLHSNSKLDSDQLSPCQLCEWFK